MEKWVSMPKVELHAHLNGSIRDSTLLELARDLGEKGVIVFSDFEHVIQKDDRSLTEVFKLFDLIHIVTTEHQIITRITKEVIEDFAAENVVYLELRTTPKKNDSIGMSKRSYLEAVLEGIKAVSTVDVDFRPHDAVVRIPKNCPPIYDTCNGSTRKKIYVRLLLSIDRRGTTEAAMETVNLALEMRDLGVVGIDLSGNPIVGDWSTYLPALKFAREQGLYITLHCGEVPNPKEIQSMLDFLPQRIGHACCFEEAEWKKLKSSSIPVEICLTSNIRTNTIPSLDIHHFGLVFCFYHYLSKQLSKVSLSDWSFCLSLTSLVTSLFDDAADLYSAKHPLVLCTDDSGVFSTSLSNEYNLAASAFGLGRREIFQLTRNAVEFIFAGDGVKRELKEIFSSAEQKLNQ